jgi:hypothetical protein
MLLYILVTVLFIIIVISDNPLFALLISALVLYGSVTLGLFLALNSYISLSEATLKVVRILFLRQTVPVKDISRIDHLPHFLGLFDALIVQYKNESDPVAFTRIEVQLYGQEQVSEILKSLVQINPRIKLDEYSEEFLRT